MTEYWSDTVAERLDETYAEDVATLTGLIDITGRVTAAELESLPHTNYVKAVIKYGSADDGFGVAIGPGDEPPPSTMSVAREVRALVEALPGRQFEGTLRRQARARHGGAISRIDAHRCTVRF